MTTSFTAAPAPASPGEERRPAPARTVGRLWWLELRLLMREPMVPISVIVFPLVMVLVLGGVFGNTPDPEFGGVSPDDHYIAGYVGVVLAALGLVTIPVHITSQKESGVLRRYRAAGITSGAIIASQVLVGAVLAVVAAAVVVVAGGAAYGRPAIEDPRGVAGWFLVGLACFVAIGSALGAVLPTARAANAVGELLFVPMFLLGGGGPPRSVMTGPMQPIADALPLSHIIGGLRLAWLGRTDDVHALWWPLLITVAAVGLALVRLRRTEAAGR